MANMPEMEHGAHRRRRPRTRRSIGRDKRESEFNHHLAGVLVILAALFFLGQPALTKRWPSARYAWPMCFLIAGVFLLVFSDTEIWPFGNQSLIYAMIHNPEDVQHKTFAVILLVLGVIEMLRASGATKGRVERVGVSRGGTEWVRAAAIPSSWRDAWAGCDEDDGKRPASTRTFRGGWGGSSGGEGPGRIQFEMVRDFQQSVAAVHDRAGRDAGDVYRIAFCNLTLRLMDLLRGKLFFIGSESVFDNGIGFGGRQDLVHSHFFTF